jgi:acyl carrier protein
MPSAGGTVGRGDAQEHRIRSTSAWTEPFRPDTVTNRTELGSEKRLDGQMTAKQSERLIKPQSRDALFGDLIEMVVEMMLSERVISDQQVAETRQRLDEQFVPDAALSELGWDSMQFASLLVHAEDRYGIVLGGLSVFDLFTVDDVVDAVWAQISQPE